MDIPRRRHPEVGASSFLVPCGLPFAHNPATRAESGIRDGLGRLGEGHKGFGAQRTVRWQSAAETNFPRRQQWQTDSS